ncbi:MAG: carboxypeptidase M32 [Candidatus Odinarchaeota archaeon]
MEKPSLDSYNKLIEIWKEFYALGNISNTLRWDMRSALPQGGIKQRAEEMGILFGIMHRLCTSDEARCLLLESEKSGNLEILDTIQQRNLHIMRRQYDDSINVPEELENKLRKQTTIATKARASAIEKNDWTLLESELKKLFELVQERANRTMEARAAKNQYESLFADYQVGIKLDYLEALFADITKSIVPLAKKYAVMSRGVRADIIEREVDIRIQKSIIQKLARFVSFDTDSESAFGRFAEGKDAFTMGNYDDVRVFVKYDENRFLTAVMSFLHESGHALYNRNLREEWRYHPVGQHAGSAVTESQAKLIENMIGRSSEFWTYFMPILNESTNGLFADASTDEFTKAVNPVILQPLRVFADELTYSIHIIIRFEIERSLFAGKIGIAEIPSIWNELYQKHLGVEVRNDAEGVLQDPHWAIGMFGHFPMYALGNIISAQLMESMEIDVPDWRNRLESGDVSQVISWMKQRIHQVGWLYELPELIVHATGRKLSAKPYIKYLKQKYLDLYG